MKKKISAIVISCIFVLFIGLTTIWAVTDLPRLIPDPQATADSEPFIGTVNGCNGLFMTVDPGSVTADGATLIIHNNTGHDLSSEHSNGVRVHVFRDGQWYPMTIRTDKRSSAAVPSIACIYKQENSPHTESVNWSGIHGRLEPGHYRVVWNFYFYDADAGQQRPGILLSAEFDIE